PRRLWHVPTRRLAAHLWPGDRRTGTPLLATATVMAGALALALFAPFERLAEVTSVATLIVFALGNLALLKLRRDGVQRRPGEISMPFIVPILGLITCVAMIVSALV